MSDLLQEIFSGGMPSPKSPKETKIEVIEPAQPIEQPKPQPVKPEPPVQPIAANQSSSSQFSDSEERQKPLSEKELLKQKLLLLRAKLKKAESLKDKAKLLEQERDKELKLQKKAQVKAERKDERKEVKENRESKEEQSPGKKATPVKKTTPVGKLAAVKPKNPAISKATNKPQSANVSRMFQNQAPEDHVDFTNKIDLVDEFAKRWWYALPPWPPSDFDFDAELARKGLQLVEPSKLKEESKIKRVVNVEAYPGVYKDADGKLHDLRPQDSMPSFQNFQKRSIPELQQLLKRAYQEQKQQVEDMLSGKCPNYDREIEVQINDALQKKLTKISRYV